MSKGKTMHLQSTLKLMAIIMLAFGPQTLHAEASVDSKIGGVIQCYNYDTPASCIQNGCKWYCLSDKCKCVPPGRQPNF